MEIIIGCLAVVVIGYLIINGKRNSDPLNRKSAAEICEYVTQSPDIDPDKIHAIFMSNARYRKQALHVVSMVPALLVKAGYPKDMSMGIAPLLRMIALKIPK